MSKTNTTNCRDLALPSTRSQYHATLVAVILLCILAPNTGAANESTPLIDYTISASPSPETPLVVDDDLEVKVNGETVFIDDDGYTTLDGRGSWKGDPITFTALPGDELEIIATNPGGGEIELSPLYLHAGDESVKLSDGVPNAPGGDLYEFFRERFTISIPAPLISILEYSPQQIHEGKDLEVKVGWSNIPAGWRLNVSLEESEENHTRLANDVSKIVSISEVISGEEVFTLKVHSVSEKHSQANVCACFYNESGGWTGIFKKTDITILPEDKLPYLLAAAAILITTLIFVAIYRKTRAFPILIRDRPIITIRRTVYDPVSKDFVSEKKLDYPEVKGWLEAHLPPDYWYIMRIDNTGGSVDEWAVELETHLALLVKEAYIEGIDRRFNLRSEHDFYKERHILSVPKDYGIPLQHNGTRRLYFRLNIDCTTVLLPVYAIAGRVIAGDDVMLITEKEFPFSCEIRKLKEVMSSSPAEVLDFVHKRAMNYYPLDAARAIVHALRLYNEINELVKSRYVDENLLKNKIKNLRESLKNVDALTGVEGPSKLVEDFLEDIMPRATVQIISKQWKEMNLFDVMMTELLNVRV